MKTKFMCWDVDNDDEADAREIEAWDAESAAIALAKSWRGDYTEEQTIAVRAPDGEVTRWTVTAEPDVRFVACRLPSTDSLAAPVAEERRN